MDDFWSKTDYIQFEKIAYEYAKFIQPDWDWKPTKRTRDGGKDGTADIVNIQTNFGRDIKKEVWYEAKHTNKPNIALPLAKIASTVLIGHNNKERVELILIVTNAFFTANTINEINIALNGKVVFVTGTELKSWLLADDQLHLRQEYKLTGHYPNKDVNFLLLGDPLIINPSCIYNVVSTVSTRLIAGKEYVLFLTLNVPAHSKQEVDFKIIGHSDLISIDPQHELKIKKGTNFLNIPFKALGEGMVKGSLITLKEVYTNTCLDICKRLTISYSENINVLNKSQAACGNELNKAFNSFIQSGEGVFIYELEGAPGHGKSWLLEEFMHEKKNCEYIYIKFRKKNELNNGWLLIRLLIFIVFGRFFSENRFEDEELVELNKEIDLLNETCEYNKYYTGYLRYLADENNTLENINKLTGMRELIPFTNMPDNKVVILDDLQFLEQKPAGLLLRILEESVSSNHKLFFICAKRSNQLTDNRLDGFIREYSARNLSIDIEKDDVIETLKSNTIYNIPSYIIEKLRKDFFVLKDFVAMASLINDKDTLSIIQDERIKKNLSGDYIQKIDYINLEKEEKEITDIVYFFEHGVEDSFLFENYQDKTIDCLIAKNIIKYDFGRKVFVPYHDIFAESLSRIIRHGSRHVYKYAIHRRDNGNIVEYLGVLGYFKAEFIRNKDYFISEVSRLHEKQKYFNTYYILSRFFSVRNNETFIGSKYDEALLLFYYAFSTFNVGNNKGLDIFSKAHNILKDQMSEQERSLSNLILSEIANCDYWDLKFKSIKDKYEKITGDYHKKKEENRMDRLAFSTISTRYISILLFTDRPGLAQTVYDETLSHIPVKDAAITSIHINLNVHNFTNNPQKAYSNLRKIIENSPDMPVKSEFIAKTHFLKMGVLLNYESTNKLEELIFWGQEQNLNYNYKIAKLQLSICYAIRHEFDKLGETIDSVMDIRDFPVFPQGIYYNLKALVCLNKHEYSETLECLNSQQKCFANMGDSFREKIKFNKKLVAMHTQEFNVDYNIHTDLLDQTFYVEARF